MIRRTAPIFEVHAGVEYRNVTSVDHHAILDNLDHAGPGNLGNAAAVIRSKSASGGDVILHPPTGGHLRSSAGVLSSPAIVSAGDVVEVWRLTETVFEVNGPITATTATKPTFSEYVLLAGQSMMSGLAKNPAGMKWGGGIINAAMDGSSIYEYEDTNYWLEPDNTAGPLLTDALSKISGKTITHIVWAHGHDNRDEVEQGTLDPADYKAGVLAIWTALGWPTIPVIVEMPGLIPPGYSDGFHMIREAYQDIRDTESNVRAYEMLERFPEPQDGTHYGAQKTLLQGDRVGRLIADGSRVPPYVDTATAIPGGWHVGFSEAVTQGDFGVPTAWAPDGLSASIMNGGGSFSWPVGAGLSVTDLPMDGKGQFVLSGFSL